ncbi:malate synthase [Catellatospora sp. TT07R-123]|uniref:malate synthase A n=1 Tax=Catellatospora sp. TT07R-123 TaxID=2733863 RepID=UPI001AFF6873|nr:malate synthase A [Catellatospora sp. TT07R-123]GHJ44642.1 malate synthase [Catellatospora sp. TT07R-123]
MTDILSPDAVEFVAELQRRFRPRRDELLAARQARQKEISRSGRLDLRPDTAWIREADWTVAPAPADLVDRRVEITGPTDRKMTINALNSGAKVWLADLEDANTPHWANVVGGQQSLYEAVRRTISLQQGDKLYALHPGPLPTIVVRPRGWHLDERHLPVDGAPGAAALVDFGLHFFHNAAELLRRGSGPYFYLPKLESSEEARLWQDVFTAAQELLGIPYGSIRATVLIETITAAFEMDEILYELRDHASGLNAGRWDYLFSLIKKFREHPRYVLPDRNSVTMAAPFLRAYAQLLVKTCHRRGAYAIGGMAAFIPNRRDPNVTANALAKVRQDKEREAADGFDGSWVAHPDLVPVCLEVFEKALHGAPNQLARQRPDVVVGPGDLLDVSTVPGHVTRAGVRANIDVGIRYLAAWLGGNGAAAINNLMEDAATAEISRSQLWQWLRHEVVLESGERVTRALLQELIEAEMLELGPEYAVARGLFEQVALADEFTPFLTLPAGELID